MTFLAAHQNWQLRLRSWRGFSTVLTNLFSLLIPRTIESSGRIHPRNLAFLSAFNKVRDEVIGHRAPAIFGEAFFAAVIKPHAEHCMAGHEVRYQDWFEFPAHGKRYMDVTYSPYACQCQFQPVYLHHRDWFFRPSRLSFIRLSIPAIGAIVIAAGSMLDHELPPTLLGEKAPTACSMIFTRMKKW